LKAFLVGGALCLVAQVLIDKTALTPARILVLYVSLGVVLTALGVYQPLVSFAGCGATTPLLGFGYSLAEGVKKAVDERGLIGALTGGLTGTAGGIAAAVFFSYIFALIFRGHRQK
jgi:stage V sporulation protein AE